MRDLIRRVTATVTALVAASVVSLGAVAPVQAGVQVFHYQQFLYVGGAWAVGPANYINKVTLHGTDGGCVNGLNVNGGALAGAWACTTAYLGSTYHDYCACELRSGVATAAAVATIATATEYW